MNIHDDSRFRREVQRIRQAAVAAVGLRIGWIIYLYGRITLIKGKDGPGYGITTDG